MKSRHYLLKCNRGILWVFSWDLYPAHLLSQINKRRILLFREEYVQVLFTLSMLEMSNLVSINLQSFILFLFLFCQQIRKKNIRGIL